MARKTRSFRSTMLRALAAPVGVALGFGITLGAFETGLVALPMDVVEQPQEDIVERPTAKGSPQWLVEKNRCWTGEAPADMVGKIPGHAVIRWEGEDAKLGGANAVGAALEHVFEGQHPNLTVYAFCR